MPKKPIILYVCHDHNLGGSTLSMWKTIEFVREYIYPIVIVRFKGPASDFFAEKGVECHVIPYTNQTYLEGINFREVWRTPWRWYPIKKFIMDRLCYLRVLVMLRKRKVDIVQSNTSICDIGMFLSRRLSAKHVWVVREFIDLDFGMSLCYGIEDLHRNIRSADAIVTISKAVAEHHNLKGKNVKLIYNPVCSSKDAVLFPDKDKYILFIANVITKRKGIETCIRAFEESRLFKDGYRLLIIGDVPSDYTIVLKKIINSSPCGDKLVLMPRTNDIIPLFSHASAFVMASNCEAFGRVTAEAMFYGCPVVAHNTGGSPELIKDGETGYLFDTVSQCAECLVTVCRQTPLDIIKKAQTYACENFSSEVNGAKYLDLYRSL